MLNMMKGTLYVVIPLILILLVILAVPGIRSNIIRRFSRFAVVIKALFSVLGFTKEKDTASLNESLEAVGYAYDPVQDIFFSITDPWQRDFGYCHLYDGAAAPMGMVIDCEPIYFEYADKKWMIEFWKGQYDLSTGCEVGVYAAKGPELKIPGVFNGTLYKCVDSVDFLYMSYSLKKNGKTLFVRKGRHWWLTGFKLGAYSEPSELTMYINITLKDRVMRDAFAKGLLAAGYSESEFAVYGNSVSLIFGKPHTSQPITRTKATDEITQKKNKLLCEKYEDVTKGCSTLQDKISAIKEKAPELINNIMHIGKPKQLFSIYETIKEYLK
jgi:hypothetical protein